MVGGGFVVDSRFTLVCLHLPEEKMFFYCPGGVRLVYNRHILAALFHLYYMRI